MKRLLLISLLLLPCVSHGSIVWIALTNWNGTTATNRIKITPVNDTPLIDGSYFQTGVGIWYSPTNGIVTNKMNGGNYQFDIAGLVYLHPPFFRVPANDTNTINVTNLLVSGGNFFVNGGVRSLVAGSGVTLSPVYGLGDVTITSTGGGGSFAGNTNQFTTNSTTSIKSGSQQTNNQFYTSGGSGNITFTDSTMAVMALFSSLNGLFFPGTSFFNQSGYTNGAGLTTISITGVDGNVVASNFVSRAGGRFTGSAGGLTNLGVIAGTNTVAYTNVVTGIVTIDSVTNPVFNNVDIGGTFFNSAGVIQLNTSSGGILWGPGALFSINQNGNIFGSNFVNVAGGKFIGDAGSVTNLSITNMDNPTFLAMAKGMESGNTFSNINRYIWTNWYAKLRLTTTTTQQITIAAVVDGLGSIGLMTKTAISPTNFGLPVVGYMNVIFPQWVGFVAGNAVQGGEHDGLWYPEWFNLPGQNDSVTFKDFFAVGPLANAVTVYYVKEPGAGHIKVETNINGGAFGVANASIDAANATFDAGIFSVTNTLGLGNVQVKITEIDSGKSVKILYPKIWNTKSNGIIFANFQGSGSDVPRDILTTNLLFSGKVWNDINPTLILDSRVTFTDDGGATIGATYTNILAWYRFCKTNFATTDIVLAGEYPNGDTSGINTLDEYIVRTNAQYYGFGYFDGWSPFVSKENFFIRGWAASLGNVHATAAGVVAYESVLIHWLDLMGYGGAIGSVYGATNRLASFDSNGALSNISNGGANTVVHGTTPPTETAVVEADQSLSDVTTANVSITKHGYAPKAPNDATKYLDGTGAYSVPPGSGGGGWSTSGNAGLPADGSAFLGTTDAEPLFIKIDGTTAVWISPQNAPATSAPDFVFGGGTTTLTNQITSKAKGDGNFIAGGKQNLIQGSTDSGIFAGSQGTIQTNVVRSVIVGGGGTSLIHSNVSDGAIIAGTQNDLGLSGTAVIDSAIIGGINNTNQGNYSIIAAGDRNLIQSQLSFAAGRRNIISHDGVFSWADSTDAKFFDLGQDTFNIRTKSFFATNEDAAGHSISFSNGVFTLLGSATSLNGNGNPATNFGTISGTQLIITGGPNWVGQTYMTNQFTATNTDSTKVAFTIGANGSSTNSMEYRTNGVIAGGLTNDTFFIPRIIASNLISMSVTADNAVAGNLGEYVESLIASGSATALTTATAKNVTSISLTAGDWDVSGNINFAATTATVTGTSGGISSTSATVPTDGSEVFSGVQVTLVSENDSVTLPRKRFSLSATTTVYLIAKSTFSAGSVSAFGQINARRVR